MPSFDFEATGPSGERVRGVEHGRDMQEVMLRLTQRGFQIVRIEDAFAKGDPLNAMRPAYAGAGLGVPAGTAPFEGSREVAAENALPPGRQMPPTGKRNPFLTNLIGPIFLKPPLRELSFFFRQLGTMIEAGVPMVQSLDTLARQSRDLRLRVPINEMSRTVDAGMPISGVMQRYPEMFSPLIISLIRAGEEGGFLGQSCRQASEYMDHEIELRNLYKRETFMPKLYVAASILIIGATNLIIASMGKEGGLSSPLNDLDTWKILAPAIIGGFLFFRVGLSVYRIKVAWDQMLLYVPYLGRTLHHFAMAKFGRAFSALYKGGVPITRSIHLAADATGNEWIRSRIYPAVKSLETGAGITKTLEDTRVFSPIVLNMMATGETTGSLDQMLLKMSEFYEDEGKVRAKQLANVVGVALMVAVGAYIGYIVISFYMGYFAKLLSGAV